MEAKVAYTITFEPRNRTKGVEPSKAVKETAAEALRLVEALGASDEKATVRKPHREDDRALGIAGGGCRGSPLVPKGPKGRSVRLT
jgi:hypothetical protein